MCCVRPGVFDAKARRLCCVNVLMAVDLPALDRPTKAISGRFDYRQLVELACRRQEASGVRPCQRRFSLVLRYCGAALERAASWFGHRRHSKSSL